MNKRFSFLSLLLGLFVCMSVLTSCSKDDDGGSSSNPLVGTWYTEASSYEEITYNSDGTCTYRRYKSDHTTIRDTDSGTYKIEGNKLSIWWESEKKYWDIDGPWTTSFSINGNKMTTSEDGGIVWTKK